VARPREKGGGEKQERRGEKGGPISKRDERERGEAPVVPP